MKKKFLGSRGQESAVFELLIAVIVMTFVIAFGMNAVSQMNQQKCVSEVNDSLEKMSISIAAVANGVQPKANIDFRIPTCFDYKLESVRIYNFDDPKICSMHCEGSEKLCTVMQYLSPQTTISKCLRISYVTTFGSLDSCETTDETLKNNYTPVDLKALSTGGEKGVPAGSYVLVKQFGREDYPIICAWLRNDSTSNPAGTATPG